MCATVLTRPGFVNMLALSFRDEEATVKQLLLFRTFGESTMKQHFNKYLSAVVLAVALVSVVGCASTPQTQGTGEYIDDAVITTKVKAALFDDPVTKAHEINVETFKGVVQLSGFVATTNEVNRAVELARAVKGVTSVKNDLRLK